MKKWMKGFKRAVAVTLAVLMVSDAVDLSALTVAAADQETSGTAITAFAEPGVAEGAEETDSVSGKSVTDGDSAPAGNSMSDEGSAPAGEYGIAMLSDESGSSEDVVSLTIGETTTNYTSLSAAVAALPKDSDATLTLLRNCQEDLTSYTIGKNVTGTVTLDLAGHDLVLPSGYAVELQSDNFIVMSSKGSGELQGGVWIGKGTVVFKENVRVTGIIVKVYRYNTTLRVEGASIANLGIFDGSCMIPSGSVEEINWSGGGLAITGGTIGKLNCESYLQRSTAFPDGYGAKDPDTGIPYTRAELDAEGFSGKMEAYSCNEHVYVEGYCKYCNALIADCKHTDLDQTTGVCGNCGLQVLAAVRSEEEAVYCTSWEALCSEAEKLVDGKTYTVYFYTDVTVTDETQCAQLQNGTVTLDLGGHNIKSGRSGTLFEIAGGAVTIENGTLTGNDKGYVLDVTGGSLRLEKTLKILWENTLYGCNLRTYGGETIINGTVMQSCIYVDGGTVTILDGSFEGVSHKSGTLNLKGGSYDMSRHAAPYDGMSVQMSGALRDLLAEGYGFRRLEDDGSASDWILEETALNGNKFDYAVKVEQLPELSITQQPEDKTVLEGEQETLSVTATSEKELTYQWYLTDAAGGTDTAVDGATAAALTLPGQSAGTSQTYYCVITCDGYPFRSNTATVTWKNNLAKCSYKDGALGYYTGEATALESSMLKVYDGSTELTEGKDYEIAADSYENNVELTADGTKAGVTLRGIGNYGGELKVAFDIVNYAISEVATLTDLSDNRLNDGDWAAGVKVKAPDGYLISSTLSGDYAESFAVGTEGQTEISYYLKETKTGYISAEKKIAVKIDQTAPVWAAADGTGEGYGISVKDNWWKELLRKVSFGLLYNDSLDIKLKASDADSGIMEYWYYIQKINESETTAGSVTPKTAEELDSLQFTKVEKDSDGGATISGKLDNDGDYVIYAYAKDNAGNVSGYICSEGIVIDRTPPDIESEQVPSKAAGTLTEHEGTFTFEASEAGMVSYFVIETTEPEFTAAVKALDDKMYGNPDHTEDMFAVKNVDGKWTLRASAGQPYRYPVSYTGADANTKTAEVTIYAQEMQEGKNEIRLSGLQPNTGYKLYLYALDVAGNWSATGGLNSEFTTLKITPIVSAAPKLNGFYGEKAKELRIPGGTVINPEDPAGSALEGTWSVTDSNAEEYLVLGTTTEYELTFTPADNVFNSVTVKVMPQVGMKTIWASIKNLERAYGQENPKLTISDLTMDWDQLAPWDTKEEILDSLTLVTDATAASTVGDYKFRIDSASTKYIIAVAYEDKTGNFSEYGTLTLKRADAVLTGADSVTKEYGDSSFKLDVTANHTESAIQYELTGGEGVVTVAEDGTVTILKAGTATIRVYLPESKNYNAAEKTITITVDKKYLFTLGTSKSFYFDRNHDGELDIRAFLPEDCGEIQIARVTSHDKVLIDKSDFNATTGMLTYQVLKNTADESAEIEITVVLENYTNCNIVFNVTWSSKLDVYVREGQKVALKNSVMNYGNKLSALEFEPVEFVDADGNPVEGTLAWEEVTMVPNCSVKSATWKFTPADERYAVLSDHVSITVNPVLPIVKRKPVVMNSDLVYDPARTLVDLDLWRASLYWSVDGKEQSVAGSWLWVNPAEIPAAGTNSYEARFKPSTDDFMSFTLMIDVTVAKAKPYIETAPTAVAITYGDSLRMSGLTGGKAVQGDGMGNTSSLTGGDAEVTGAFGWSTPDVKPAVSDSNTTEYEVIFTPADTDNYEPVTTKIKLTVNKAENAPDMPGDVMSVAYKCKKVSDVALDRENWVWQDNELETALDVGVETTATAVYTGADQGNYENETVAVKITRSACEHPETVVRDAAEATCTVAGYTGDTYCTECGVLTASGTVIPAKGHSYTSEITKQPTTTEEGIRTYTCKNCSHQYTETVAKLDGGDPGTTDPGTTDPGTTDPGTTAPGTTDPGTTDPGTTDPGATDSGSGTQQSSPFIKGENGKEGWDVIRENVKVAAEGSNVTVDMNGTTVVPSDVFETIRGRDVTIAFDMGGGIIWRVNGRDVAENRAGDIDFGVKTGANANNVIPVAVINNVTGEKAYMNLSLAYDGEFGFKAVLSLNMDAKNAGLYANLYYYNEQTGVLEFMSAGEIAADGTVQLAFTHASEYTIVIDRDVAVKSPKTGDADDLTAAEKIPAHAMWLLLVCAAVLTAGAATAYTAKRRGRK